MSVLLAALAALAVQTGQPTPDANEALPPGDDVVVLDEIVVDGRPIERYVRDFIRDIGATARDRGLARWRDRVCVGVANMEPEAAQYIADRISEVALDLGLRPGEPGCTPNLIVVASHGRHGLERLLLGSVAEEVSRKAAGPVLITRVG